MTHKAFAREEELLRELTALRQQVADLETQDITEQCKAERSLSEQLQFFQQMLNTIPIPVFYKDRQGVYRGCNRAFEDFFGLSREQIIGKTVYEMAPQELADKYWEMDQALFRQPGTQTYDFQVQLANGSRREVVFIKATYLNADGRVGGLVGVMRDTTARRQAVEELRRQREDYQMIFDSVPALIIYVDKEHRVIRANRVAEQILGRPLDQILGKTVYDLFSPEDAALYAAGDDEVMRTGQPVLGLIEPFHTATGESRWVQTDKIPLRDARGEVTGLVILAKDITERKGAEESLAHTSRALKTLSACNLALVRATEEAAFLQEICRIIVDSGGYQRAWVAFPQDDAARSDRDSEEFFHDSPAMALPLVVADRIIGALNICSQDQEGFDAEEVKLLEELAGDVAYGIKSLRAQAQHKRAEEEKARLEVQLRQAQKMEAIGTLAGGIAHDFNNILLAILGYAEVTLLTLDEGLDRSQVKANLEEVLRAGERAKDLVKQILTFSRLEEQEIKPVQLAHQVQEALKLVRASLPASINIHSRINLGQGLVMANPTQITQVVMNLCTNAYQAMRDRGGALQVALEPVQVDAATAAAHLDLHEGPYLRLSVRDNGPGLAPGIRERIFEPYFTTKGPGEGTGLGLSVVHGIVTRLGGAILVLSEPGRGATFEVYLPRLNREAQAEESVVAPIPRGKEHILFVDDEPQIAGIVQRLLQHLGYQATVKTDSLEALAAFAERPQQFDLVITDLAMSHLTGLDLAAKLLDLRPDLPIILCTGFGEPEAVEQARRLGIREFLQKPITTRDLAHTIRRVLEHPSGD